jgi:hypothetical protein
MSKTNLLKSCQFLLIVNIAFWVFAAFYFSFFNFATNSNYLIIKILLFTEPILYLISLVGVIKKIKLIYIFSILFTLGNAILSITDQVGLYDAISLILSASVFLNLIFIWKYIFIKKEDS